jgi:hypothetical protein
VLRTPKIVEKQVQTKNAPAAAAATAGTGAAAAAAAAAAVGGAGAARSEASLLSWRSTGGAMGLVRSDNVNCGRSTTGGGGGAAGSAGCSSCQWEREDQVKNRSRDRMLRE